MPGTPVRASIAAAIATLVMLGLIAGRTGTNASEAADGTPAAATAPAAATPAAPAGDPAKGKVVYEKNCVPCHKQEGTGGMKLIATGNPSRNFRDPEFWKNRTDAQIQHSIETGFPKSGMVSWKGVLKPEEIRNVIAYLHFKFQPKGTTAKADAKADSKSVPATSK